MSRSRPQTNNPSPVTRRFEWDGANGNVRYYDKAAERRVAVPNGFTFILLDRLQGIGGYNDATKSGIYSNEIRDTRTDRLVVKSHKGGIIAEGLYNDIKARVTSKSVGGQFVVTCYLAYKGDDGALALGSMQFKGASLGAWMDFEKDNRGAIYGSDAVQFTGSVDGQKGNVRFKSPTFRLVKIAQATEAQAFALDQKLQTYLDAYFNVPPQAATGGHHGEREPGDDDGRDDGDPGPLDPGPEPEDFHEGPRPVAGAITDDDIPF